MHEINYHITWIFLRQHTHTHKSQPQCRMLCTFWSAVVNQPHKCFGYIFVVPPLHCRAITLDTNISAMSSGLFFHLNSKCLSAIKSNSFSLRFSSTWQFDDDFIEEKRYLFRVLDSWKIKLDFYFFNMSQKKKSWSFFMTTKHHLVRSFKLKNDHKRKNTYTHKKKKKTTNGVAQKKS